MAIQPCKFDNENELHSWVESQVKEFFGDVIYVPGTFFINTKGKKGGRPDGLVLDMANSSWTIVESELLQHGVWDHIAEQIIRFVVAAKNPETIRRVRDAFLEKIESEDQIGLMCQKIGIPRQRLVHRIEQVLETGTPDIAIFIDEINDDLRDFVAALAATARIYRVQKYNVNERIEYAASNGCHAQFERTVEEVQDNLLNDITVLDLLGGGELALNLGGVKLFDLANGERIAIRKSKYYERSDDYWFGITPLVLEKYRQNKLTHVVFVLGWDGLFKVPLATLEKYIEKAYTPQGAGGTIKHYNIIIKGTPEPRLHVSNNITLENLEGLFMPPN